MHTKLKKFLIICSYAAALAVFVLCQALIEECMDMLYIFFLTKTSSEILAPLCLIAVLFAGAATCYFIHKACAIFTEKIMNNYQAFKDENSDFSEIYNDPTISLKDKILFFAIYSIYYIQLPFLYCASKISPLFAYITDPRLFGHYIALTLINATILIPVVLLELIKYPLVKLFSPLGLNVNQLSFLFNISGVGNNSQNVHTSSFEYSIIACAQELKEKYGNQSTVLNKEFEDYIKNSDEITDEQKDLLKLYINFDGSNSATWQESKTGITLTQAVNLVLTAAKDQKFDMELLKCMLLMRLKEGNGKCNLGMFNRIIYSLSCLESKNNFIVEVNSQVYERMPNITKQFLLSCNSKKVKILKDNFDDFYYEKNLNSKTKDDISKLMEDAKQYVFNELYVHYYNQYGKDVGRGPIKDKLKELITIDDIKEAINAVIDGVDVPPTTFFEKMKIFMGLQKVDLVS